jgi:hypothetical protein
LSEEQTPVESGGAASTRRASTRRGAARRGPKGSRPSASRRGPLTVFIHIPKTAGTTLVGVLRGNFPPGGVRTIGNVFHGAGGIDQGPITKLRQSGPVVTRDIHLLGGHLPFGVSQYLPNDTRYITFLRDPVERTLSHYYRARSVRKRDPIPEDMTFEDVLGGGDYLYDNLQTRMLSGDPEPFGKVTDKMLERAKQNLAEKFISFGLAERFDESLVLLKARLGLRSILYVTQRMTTNRPRTQESKEDLAPIAERFNTYDIELYRWASEQFDHRVADQDAEFAIDLAALKTAVAVEQVTEPTPTPSTLSADQLWEQLVRARAELLGWEYQLAKANDPDESRLEELTALLKQANRSILELHERIDGLESTLGGRTEDIEEDESGNGAGRRQRKGRSRASGRLAQLRERIEELEQAVGDQPESTSDAHVVRELERLRTLAAELEQEQEEDAAPRRPPAEDRSSKAERRQTPAQRMARIASLTKTRDNIAKALERSEKRLEELRAEFEQLRTTNAADDKAPASGDDGPAVDPEARIERLRDLTEEKKKRIELQKVRLSELERRLSTLTEPAVSSTDE